MIKHEEFLKRLARHADGTGTKLPAHAPTEFTNSVLARVRGLERESPWARLAPRALPFAAAAALLSFALGVPTHRESSSTTEPETSLAHRIFRNALER